jgi:hypothetical protein
MTEQGHYVIHLGGADIVQCPGGQTTALEHLKQLRNEHIEAARAATGKDPETVPWLIGVYPPHSVGGREGKGGVFSYGYTPTLFGSIGTPRTGWVPSTSEEQPNE